MLAEAQQCGAATLAMLFNQDSLAEWSKALASGASPQGRGFEPHSCHFCEPSAARSVRSKHITSACTLKSPRYPLPPLQKCVLSDAWPRGVTVSTLDSESSDRGSNPREAFFGSRHSRKETETASSERTHVLHTDTRNSIFGLGQLST